MHASPRLIDILYVGEEPVPEPVAAVGRSLTVSAGHDSRPEESTRSNVVLSRIEEHSPDCLVLSDQLETGGAVELLETVGAQHPSLPTVAFVTEESAIETLGERGVTELVNSKATDTPEPLVERRIRTAIAVSDDGLGNEGPRESQSDTVQRQRAGSPEQPEREETLRSLYRGTEEFLTAETPQEVSEVVVDTASQVLDISGIGMFLFDDGTNLLSPVAGTEQFLELFGETRVFGPGKADSITWHTYVTGETRAYDDVRESRRLANPDTAARASILVPLGGHGVLVAASTEPGIFSDGTRDLLKLLARTAETALDRVTGQEHIRERTAELQAREAHLEELNRYLSISHDLSGLFRECETRDELEAQLCDNLVDYDSLMFAWIGSQPADSDDLEERSWEGSPDGYLEALSSGCPDAPAKRTALSGNPTIVSNVSEHIHEEQWATEAINRGLQSVLSLPIRYGQTSYGVLTLYANEPGAFDYVTEKLARQFGETLGFGLNAIETRQAVFGERSIEVSTGDTETVMNRIAQIANQTVAYGITKHIDTTQLHFALAEPPSEEILSLETEFVTVESLDYANREHYEHFRVEIAGQSVVPTILDCGGVPESITADSDTTVVRATIPPQIEVESFLERMRQRYPTAELVSEGDPEAHSGMEEGARERIREQLTDRQEDVLRTAYERGYFRSPRNTTGQELAGSLDISQPTFTHHLRNAQHLVFEVLLDDH